jgi:superfamily II DNA/RNA helicase
MSFESMGLAQPLLSAIEALGFTTPTPVQEQAIPAGLQGGDWMVSSQTGSGKTAAYLLPLLHHLILENDTASQAKDNAAAAASTAPATEGGEPAAVVHTTPGAFGKSARSGKSGTKGSSFRRAPAEPRVLVLCPTRELAEQVCRDAIDLLKQTRGMRVAMIIGGMPFPQQIAALQGAHIVVATPGRLLDLENKRSIRLDSVRSLVVDEADRMLDLGFQEDLEAIHDLTSARDQTLMFSATFAPRIMELAETMMTEPGRIEVGSAQEKHQDITQSLHWADNYDHKRKLLDHLIRDTAVEQAVIFVSTQIDSESLSEELEAEGHSVAAMHGAMPQFLRQRRLRGLREGKVKILVATDVAARGLDVPTISHVINFGLPMKAEDYVHRIGRTGRAGRSGIAITLADHRDRFKIRDIERYTQQPIQAIEIPGLEPKAQPKRGGSDRGDRGGREGGRGGAGGGFGGGRSFGGGRESAGRGGFGGGGGGFAGGRDRNSGAGRDGARTGYAARPQREASFASGTESSFRSERPARPAREGGFSEPRAFESRAPEGRFGNNRPQESRFAEPKFGETKFGQSRFAEQRQSEPRGESRFGRKPEGESRFGQPKFGESKFGGPKFGEPKFGESKFGGPKTGESKFGESRFAKKRFDEPRTFEPRAAVARTSETRASETRASETRFGAARPAEPRTGESRFERKPAGAPTGARPAGKFSQARTEQRRVR